MGDFSSTEVGVVSNSIYLWEGDLSDFVWGKATSPPRCKAAWKRIKMGQVSRSDRGKGMGLLLPSSNFASVNRRGVRVVEFTTSWMGDKESFSAK